MKITEILRQDKLTVSFEVFPPKADAAFENVWKAAEQVAAMKPSFVSVTYGAAGGASKNTLNLASHLKEQYGIPVLAHLTCISSTRETVQNRIAQLRQLGLENVMALRGDRTPDTAEIHSPWQHASELVRELKDSGADFCIGGACYPEVHPDSANSREDIAHLREKVNAGCDFLTTQMLFDNSLFYSFLYRIREAGITVPVLPGIMPITNKAQIQRAIELSGSFIPQRFLSLADRFGEKPEAMKQAGIAYATDQIIDLFSNGIRNVHIYTMNKADVAGAILRNLSHILE